MILKDYKSLGASTFLRKNKGVSTFTWIQIRHFDMCKSLKYKIHTYKIQIQYGYEHGSIYYIIINYMN